MLRPNARDPAHRPPPGAVPSPHLQPQRELPLIRVLRFFTKFKRPIGQEAFNPDGTANTLHEEHWVEWVKIGDASGATCIEAVKRVMPRDDREGYRAEWDVVGPAYEAWLRNEEAPVNGTPLYAWSGVSRELADELKKQGITTIEEVANYPDHRISALPIPGFRELRIRAKATLEARDASNLGDIIAAKDIALAEMKREKAETDARLAAMQATIDAMAAQQGLAVRTIMGAVPSADDEFVKPGPNDRPVGASDAGFQRRQPVDHIAKALGEIGSFEEASDDDVTD